MSSCSQSWQLCSKSYNPVHLNHSSGQITLLRCFFLVPCCCCKHCFFFFLLANSAASKPSIWAQILVTQAATQLCNVHAPTRCTFSQLPISYFHYSVVVQAAARVICVKVWRLVVVLVPDFSEDPPFSAKVFYPRSSCSWSCTVALTRCRLA